jgi:hypothetical protein
MSQGRKYFILLALLWFGCGAAAWGARMPRGSFLLAPAYSAAQLAAQVKAQVVVAQRFEKHFGVPAQAFASYVQTQLGLRPLARSGSYRVFFIRKDGTIGSQVRRLKKGTAVFVHLRTGRPVLLAECGNPMGTSLPGYVSPPRQSIRGTEGEPPVPSAATPEEPLAPPMQTLDTLTFDDPSIIAQLQDAELMAWDAPSVLLMPELPMSSGGTPFYASAPSLTPLFMVGLSGLFSSGGGPSGRGGPTPPPVPEPGSLVLWAIGLGAAYLGGRKARQKTRQKS